MAEVVPIHISELEGVLPLLHQLNPSIDNTTWQRLFDIRWQRPQTQIGYALMHEGEAVGFLGMLFSQRKQGDTRQPWCNLTTWIVAEPFRNESLALLSPLGQLKDYTITNLSPSPEAYAIFKAFGFKPLDDSMTFVPWRPARDKSDVEIKTDYEVLETLLPDHLVAWVQDHQIYGNCLPVLFSTKAGPCLVMYRERTKGRWFWFTQLYAVSDWSIFWQYFGTISEFFRQHQRTWMTLMDTRWVNRAVAGPLTLNVPSPKLYRSRHVAPVDIDYLYTEKILLNR